MIREDFVEQLLPFVEVVDVCPEVEIGMGTPRESLRIVENEGKRSLYQPATQKHYTDQMNSFTKDRIAHMNDVDGFLLKSKSPSCGLYDARIYNGFSESAMHQRGAGFWGDVVLRAYPGAAIEDEMRLKNFTLRENFLVKLFSFARLRELSFASISEVMRFQENNKILLMAYGHSGQKKLGKILGDYQRGKEKEVYQSYAVAFREHLARPPSFRNWINALQHAFGGLKKSLTSPEKKLFLNSLDEYRAERLPLSAIIKMLHAWALAHENHYLLAQTILSPYPADLIDLSDTGKGRGSARG